MDNFISFLSSATRLSDDAKSDLQACLTSFEVAKNYVLLKQGQVCRYLYFVEKGLLRLFYLRDGKDITDYFATEQSIIGGIDSFFSQQPSEKIIEALRPCTLIAISFDDLEKLYRKHHDVERAGRILATAAFLSMQKRLFSIQFHTAKNRYEELLKSNPGILQQVPLGYIASFLGVTQVTLSRVRGQR